MPKQTQHAQQRKWLKKLILICLAIILLLLLSQPSFSKQVTVRTDHQQVQMGDIITLMVETDFSTQAEPDFDQMQDQFDLLGTQRSNQIQITNGNYQSITRWVLHISPKQVGELVIPPFKIEGILSQPLMIEVADTQHPSGQNRGSSFLESSLNLNQVTVQQEVLFTLRFYHQGRFIDGNIRPPVFKDALSEPIQNQFHYQTQIGGERYEVYQWTWVFYPQKSGDFVIPPQAFYGRIQYQGRLKQVKDQTQPIVLVVQPKPSAYPQGSAWIPAESLELTEDWQINQPIRIGDALTRTVTLRTQGQLHSQLPEWNFANQAAYHLYPEPEQAENKITEQGVESQKSLSMTLVPTQAGNLIVPELKLHWWNTQTDQLETTTLPAKTLTILPALTSQNNASATPPENDSRETLMTSAKPLPQSTETTGWQIAVGALMGLWFITVLGFSFWIVRLHNQLKQRAEGAEDAENNQAWSKLSDKSAVLCQKTLTLKDAKALFIVVLAWQQSHPNQSSDALNQHLKALKAHLYGNAPIALSELTALCDELKRLSETQATEPVETNRLAPIYPTQRNETQP